MTRENPRNKNSRPQDPPHDGLSHDERRARRPQTRHPLLRSRRDRVIAGVLGGVAGYVGANPGTVRLIFALSTVLSGGVMAIGYVLMWLLLPLENA